MSERMVAPPSVDERRAWAANPTTRRLLEVIDDAIAFELKQGETVKAEFPYGNRDNYFEAVGAKRALGRIRDAIANTGKESTP